MNLSSHPKMGQIIRRGLMRRCPSCGQSPMFHGYLKPFHKCGQCGLNFDLYRSDDAPAYFTVALVGHLILPAIWWSEIHFNISLFAHFILWIPLTILLTLVFLPFIKGIVMAVLWHTKASS